MISRKRINKLIIITFVLIILIFTNSSKIVKAIPQDIITYKSATEYDYPPFSVTRDGKADGFSVDLLKAVAYEMGFEVEFKIDYWSLIKNELEEGKLDILPLVGYSKKRDQYLDFTVPYIVMRGNIFVRKNYKEISSEEDLYGKEIIVMKGDNSQEYAEKMDFTDNLILADTYSEAFKLLSSGKYDAVLAQSLVGQKLINKLEIKNVEAVALMDNDGIKRTKVSLQGYEQKFCFAVKEGNKNLLALLNEGLAIVSENGTYETLYMKWFPFLLDVEPDYTRIAFYFFSVLILISLVLFMISFYMVKKEVRRQTAQLKDNLFRNTIMFNVMRKEYASISDWLDYVINEMTKMTSSEFGYIFLVNEDKDEYILSSCSEKIKQGCLIEEKIVTKLDETSIWSKSIKEKKPIIINDFNSINPSKSGYLKSDVKVKRLMTVPIFEDTQIVAAVGLANKKNKYDDNDVYQITALMSGIWNMIERAKYREELEVARNKYLSTLVSIGDAVIVIGLDEKIEMINKVCAQLTGWSEEEAKGVNYKEVFKLSHENSSIDIIDPVLKVLKTGIGHELDSHAVLTSKRNEMFIIEDSAAPIKNMQNEMIGVVLVFRDVTQKQRQIKRIKYLSFHDVLTGLYNRRFFEEAMIRLDSANNYPLTIILADLNGLKLTNDAFGHYEGDKLLKETADIIRLNIRENHIAARWGGDEFAILMPKTTSEEAKNIIKILNDKIDKKNDKKDKAILSVAFGWETKVDRSTSLNNIFKIAEEYMYKRKISESQSVRGLTIKTIIYTLFEKSPRERRHSQNVQEMATKIAKAMKLSQNKVDDISTLAYFHDIGKITVSSEILEKKERLTLAEYEEIKKHPSVGYRMMTAINEFSNIAQGVLSHHERWDGKGYPNGLKENEIPLEARIIAIADAYDAMTEARFNKAKLSKEDAIIEMKKGSNTKFDPHIVKVFIEEVLMSKKSS